MARRTKADALVTRDHLLDAAERVFEQRGVSRTSLNDIAQAAGLSRGAVYWHFENKADVFHAMMQRVILPLEEAAQRAAGTEALEPLSQVRANFLNTLHGIARDPQVCRVFRIATHKVEFVDEMLGLYERKRASRSAWLKNMESAVALAAQRGHIRDTPPPRVVAIGLHALIDGLIRSWVFDPTVFDLVAVGTQVLDTYLAGLALPPPAAETAAKAARAAPARKRAAPQRRAP